MEGAISQSGRADVGQTHPRNVQHLLSEDGSSAFLADKNTQQFVQLVRQFRRTIVLQGFPNTETPSSIASVAHSWCVFLSVMNNWKEIEKGRKLDLKTNSGPLSFEGELHRALGTMKEIWRALFVMVLFVAALLSLTMEKVSFIWTVRAAGRDQHGVVLLLLALPYALAFVQGIWNVPFLVRCRDTRLPPLRNILLGLMSSVLEAACLVWFTCLVVPFLPAYVVLLCMNTVMTVPLLSPWLASPHGPGCTKLMSPEKNKTGCSRGQRIVLLLCCMGPVLAAVILYVTGSMHWLSCLVMAGSLLLLAMIWSPGVLYRTFSVDGEATENCRRLNLVYTTIKLLSIIFFFGVDLMVFSAAHLSWDCILQRFRSAFSDIGHQQLWMPLAVNVVAGLVSHSVSYLSAAFCQPVFGMLIPSILSALGGILLCVGVFGPYIYHVDELKEFGDMTPLLLSAGILACTWALSYVFRARYALHRPGFLFMTYEDLLLDYGWCPGFSDQKRLMSYCADGAGGDKSLRQPVTAKKSRVYVCTTMYREADYEMERLLISLQKLSGSKTLPNVYLEAHIFMDNGINDTRLGDFAEQLVGLLVSRIGMNPEEARYLQTPYGLQLTWFFPGGMPLFIHFKDPVKIKPKKRWSQCMYINYIMNFRKALWKQDNSFSSLAPGGNTNDIYYISSENPNNLSDGTSSWLTSHKLKDVGYPTLLDLTAQCQLSNHQDAVTSSVSSFSHEICARSSNNEKALRTRTSHGDTADNDNLNLESHSQHPGAQVYRDVVSELDASTSKLFQFDPEEEVDDDHTYILATDADMDFEPDAVADLLNMCNSDYRLGAACGRTHPIGKHCSSIVWHQIFEYAKDFWMIKSAQNVIGSVMCCPGCFSLYRGSAIRQVMDKYSTPTRTPFTVYVKDTGEDRWMATLMMIQGWRLRYSAFANNTTYCPDTFEEFFKQRRRWILSDIANLILVVQHLPRLLRNNQCFSFVYVMYLLNMFMNNVITPGTAIVMITAGMELVFEVPYAYTTLPLATAVYSYALFCTRYSTRSQTILTSILTLVLGSIFTSVAVWGSYKIVAGMVREIGKGNFQFQQHYIILMLTLSLLYAALVHPKEMYQIIYGMAYLFIFPAMHLLLPIYSIANIIDQSWGTRDSQTAKIPKLRCIPNLKKLMKWKKKNKGQVPLAEDTSLDIQQMVTSMTRSMAEGSAHEQSEQVFWENLGHTLIGNDVNRGLERGELAHRLEELRNRSLLGLLFANALWLAMLSYFYVGIDSPLSRLNLYGIISGALYGFTLIIQVIGMTICRVNHILVKLARYLYGDKIPLWVYFKE